MVEAENAAEAEAIAGELIDVITRVMGIPPA
jgi:hypothetical protein